MVMSLVGDQAFYRLVRGFSSLQQPVIDLWRGLKAKGFFNRSEDCWGCKSRALSKTYKQVLRAFTTVFSAIHDKNRGLLQDLFVYLERRRGICTRHIVCFHKVKGKVRKLEVHREQQ